MQNRKRLPGFFGGRGYSAERSSGRGRGRGRGGTVRDPPTMSQAVWAGVKEQSYVNPDVLRHGLPPKPWDAVRSGSAAYADYWKKLVFLELHHALQDFRAQLSSPRTPFKEPPLILTEKFKCDEPFGGGRWTVAIGLTDPDTPCEISVADLPHTILKLEDIAGWFYVYDVQPPQQSFPVTAVGYLYDDDFCTRDGKKHATSTCVPFESFLTFRYRVGALTAYTTEVRQDVRAALEIPGLSPASPASSSQLQQLPRDQSSPLNAGQLAVLRRLRWPVDFVQGPPGTGKSFFIVEFLKLLVPPGNRVLLCTTTNKAIDSLAEKLVASGFGHALLAFGSESRLGRTSARCLLANRVAAHPVTGALQLFLQVLADVKRGLVQADVQMQEVRNDAAKRFTSEEFVSSTERRLVQDQRAALRAAPDALSSLPATSIPTPVQPHLEELQQVRAGLKDALQLPPACSSAAAARQAAETALFKANDAASRATDAVRSYILDTARYYVCTATTAVRLPDRITRERGVSSLPAAKSCSTLSDDDEELKSTVRFEYVVLDEAGAMLEPDVVGTIIHGCKFLLAVGDHLQLPPFTAWRDASHYQYSVSMLERHAEHLPPSHNLMTEQYRMAPHISELVSALSYRGALTTAAVTAAARQRSPAMTFVDVCGEELRVRTSYCNQAEVEAVLRLVRTERSARPTQLINVIAFYKPQMYALRDALKRVGLLTDNKQASLDDPATLDVVTVDSMQGREADIIILSCTRTTPDIGFLRDLRRLNVAISRAKEMLYVVGHKAALLNCDCVPWHKVVGHCK